MREKDLRLNSLLRLIHKAYIGLHLLFGFDAGRTECLDMGDEVQRRRCDCLPWGPLGRLQSCVEAKMLRLRGSPSVLAPVSRNELFFFFLFRIDECPNGSVYFSKPDGMDTQSQRHPKLTEGATVYTYMFIVIIIIQNYLLFPV